MNEIIRNSEVVLLLAITAVVESLFANYFPVALYLDLPLVFALYIGWYSSPARGAVCGIGFGWLQDAISGIYLGLNGLTKTLMGFGAAYLRKWLIMEGLLARSVLIGLLSLLDDTIVVGIRALLGQTIQQETWVRILIQMPVTGLAGGLFFFIYDRFKFPEKDFRQL
ncbi:rod shape-determining protein MreD [Acidobacteria bacterium AH-259-D05]|nr:rod shape-determining protein MreD [Acidobacteria bacterium AH-259-D05]